MKTLLYALIATGCISTLAMAGHDIAVNDLPKPVKDSINAQFETPKLIKAEKETKRGMVIYEVTIEKKDLSRQEVKLKENGDILKVELDD